MILERADQLLRSGNLEDIQNFLPDIVATYCKLDDMVAENEENLDKIKINTYVALKQKKKKGENSYSDKDIEVLAKKKAMDVYSSLDKDRKAVSHIKLYIEQLSQRKIDLQVQNKNLREGVSM